MNKKIQRLYIHVPFCSRKCDYCAFYSEPAPTTDMIKGYLSRLEEEFIGNAPLCSELNSIYIGGGTPSLLNIGQLTQLFEKIVANFAISQNAEVSIECNPESLNAENVPVIANFANRVSIGVQSFNCEFRKTIGRSGNVKTINNAVELLNSNGIDNLGIDLIYAIPGETLDDWKSELKKAISLPVKHISAYSLTFEEGTELFNRNCDSNTNISSDIHMDNDAAMWEYAGDFLQDNGFPQYEISNYAHPEYTCKHNEGIWLGDTYLGCGPAAASFDGQNRWVNPSSLDQWLAGEKAEIDIISPEKRAKEIFVMGLRTTKGWESDDFMSMTGYKWEDWLDELSVPINSGLLEQTEKNITCNRQGLLLWNEIAEILI
jgi:putative oxygen-independent coproporphyrinogen III oxidase